MHSYALGSMTFLLTSESDCRRLALFYQINAMAEDSTDTIVERAIDRGTACSFYDDFASFDEKHRAILEEGHSPVLQSSFQTDETSVFWKNIASFERMNLELRARVLGLAPPKNEPLQTIEGQALAALIKTAIRKFENSQKRGNSIVEPKFHFEGLKIEGQLDLSGVNFPGSLRLINCFCTGALNITRASLETLDISGSIFAQGVSAPHIQISGALRLRRTLSMGILDFGAAPIMGPLDAADSIVVPINMPPSSIKWVADRGVVNLGLARIGKEMRLNRVRWFGGVNMRGMTAEGSLFLTDAILRSPMAVAEKVAVDALGTDKRKCLPQQLSAATAEIDLALLLHAKLKTKRKWSLDVEILDGLWIPGCPTKDAEFDRSVFERTLLARLLFERIPVQTNALRADGANIHGVFGAEGMRVGGRVRLKKVIVKSALTLSGGHFRTFRSLRKTLSEFGTHHSAKKHAAARDFCEFLIARLDEAETSEPDARRQYAIDLRRAQIGASLEMRRDSRKIRRVNTTGAGARARKAVSDSNRRVAQQIARTLCETGEDPAKFLQVFFDRPGEVNQFLDNPKNARKVGFFEFLSARKKLREIGARLDPDMYELLEFEEAFENREPDNKHLEDEKYRPDQPGARIYRQYEPAQIEEVVQICGGLARVKSTLLIGEISLSGAHIGGSLSLLGFVANVFGEDDQTRSTLLLDNATIQDDFDLRDSVGINGLSAEQANIGGSIRMADAPKFMLKHDRFGPARRRALCVGSVEAEITENRWTPPKYNFERATVGGNATLIFDRETGPTLDLALARISGELVVLPAVGGLELNKLEYADDAYVALQKMQGGSVSIQKISQWVACKTAGLIHWLVPNENFRAVAERVQHIEFSSSDSKRNVRKYKPTIDLRHLETTVVGHPPSSWPQFDGLLLEGLRYDRTKDYGPLLSRRRTWRDVQLQSRSNPKFMFFTLLAAVIASFSVPAFANILATLMMDIQQLNPIPEHAYEVFGPWNVRVFQTILGISFWIGLLKFFTHPRASEANPMAIDYLKRQRRKFNVRRVSAAIHPYEPYIHAAKTLRASGYMLSADKVELERLRMRRLALSWRTAGPLRILLKMTDLTMNYGFAPIRLIGLTVVLIAAGSFLTTAGKESKIVEDLYIQTLSASTEADAQTASDDQMQQINKQKQNSFLRTRPRVGGGFTPSRGGPNPTNNDRTDTKPGPDETQVDQDKQRLNAHIEGNEGARKHDGETADGSELRPQMIPFVYVLDVVVPFLDLGQESRFRFMRPRQEDTAMRQWWVQNYWVVPVLLKLFGWILTSLIAISIAARLETIMARNEEA